VLPMIEKLKKISYCLEDRWTSAIRVRSNLSVTENKTLALT
jgi:hypothetical protein